METLILCYLSMWYFQTGRPAEDIVQPKQTSALIQLDFVMAFILHQDFTNKDICYQLSKHLHTLKEKKGSPDSDRKFQEFGH